MLIIMNKMSEKVVNSAKDALEPLFGILFLSFSYFFYHFTKLLYLITMQIANFDKQRLF